MESSTQKKRIKIGYISYNKLDDTSAWSGTISFLAKFLDNEFDVVPIVLSERINKIWYRICDIFHLKSSMYRLSCSILNLILLLKIRTRKCDVLFAPAVCDLVSYGVSKKIPLIYLSDATYHLMFNYYYHNMCEGRKDFLNRTELSTLQRANAAIFASDWAAADAVSYYGIAANKVYMLPLPAYLPDCFQGKSDDPGNVVHLLLVGVDWKRKGVDIAIEATRILNSSSHDKRTYILTIVGLDKPENFNNNDNINFVGRLDKSDEKDLMRLVRYYQQSDIFILPTKAECAGIVFSEAAMYGLPTVTYSTGGVETYVENQRTGFCLPEGASSNDFADAIRFTLKPGQYRKFSLCAREKYENKLSWTVWLNRFSGIVNSLLIKKDL